jgi:hypothetical protein
LLKGSDGDNVVNVGSNRETSEVPSSLIQDRLEAKAKEEGAKDAALPGAAL